jgi:catechol 2,3-dioxygenase-like lactoylglutathione lyase family enzyme
VGGGRKGGVRTGRETQPRRRPFYPRAGGDEPQGDATMNFANNDAMAMLAVKDLDRAQRFYEDVLGLEKTGEEGEEVIAYRSGNSTINVYRSEFAGTNKATALTWQVDDLDAAVRDLKAKGVTFEHYQIEGLREEGDIYVGGEGEFRTAWFKDPDGNILNVVAQ